MQHIRPAIMMILVMTLILRRRLVEGLTFGAVK